MSSRRSLPGLSPGRPAARGAALTWQPSPDVTSRPGSSSGPGVGRRRVWGGGEGPADLLSALMRLCLQVRALGLL